MKRSLTDFEAVRAQDLLAQRATQGLDDTEASELLDLGATNNESFEVAAAAVDVATLPREAMPQSLAEKVFENALEGLRGRTPTGSPSTAPAVPAVAAVLLSDAAPSRRERLPDARPRRRLPIAVMAGWATAAAAATLAIVAWTRDVDRPPAPSPATARQELAAVDDALAVRIQPGSDAAGVNAAGDIVWSPGRQRGFLRVSGLAANATATRYQLWIFDRGRDDRYPVDGGLFDVASSGETIVPIEAQIPIAAPVQFLITAESSSGVVVSDRARVVGVAYVTAR